MKNRNRKIPPFRMLSFVVFLTLFSVTPQPSVLAFEFQEREEPGFPLLEYPQPTLLPDSGEKTDINPFMAEGTPQHWTELPDDSSEFISDSLTIEEHHLISPRNSSSEIDSIQVPAAPDGWTTITSEDFEGAFPGPGWSVFDADGATNGEYYWDDDSYRPHNGSWSAWPANGGADAVAPPANYPNNMQSWLKYGPFDLSDASDAELLFYYWLFSEEGFDTLGWYASIDDTNYYGTIVSGNSSGWAPQNFDLTAVPVLGDVRGQSSVWIAFVFSSDSSVTAEGAYLDDILLRKNTGLPNLKPFTPSGWDYPIVPSSVTSTNSVGTLFTYQNTYIDWSVKNTGTATAIGSAQSCLYFDSSELNCVTIVNLGENFMNLHTDWLLNLTPTPGWHTLTLVTDVYNDVPESNENDNTWSKDFYWHPDANLSPYKQGSWDFPLVPSSVTGTHSVNDLYTYENTYIDWTIKNFGPEDILAQFDTCLYLDNVELNCWFTNGKIAGNIAYVEDWVLNTTPTPGLHTLKVVTDVNDDVIETDETDNSWSKDFYWNPPFPDIDISPSSLTSQQPPDKITTTNFEIFNYGNLPLNWSIVESPTDSCSPGDIPWVSVSPDSGTTSQGSIDPIDVVIDSTGLAIGTYQGFLCIDSDDPDEPLVSVPISLDVVEILTTFLPMLLR